MDETNGESEASAAHPATASAGLPNAGEGEPGSGNVVEAINALPGDAAYADFAAVQAELNAWEDANMGDDTDSDKGDEVKEVLPKDERPGCEHYRRYCKIVAPCCNEVYFCRHCHNDVHFNPEKSVDKLHELDRKAVKEVICVKCEERQPPSSQCVKCDVKFAAYYCPECKFWDDDGAKKEVFHCEDCGICRVGGRANYFHCKTCGSCYPHEIRESHKCIEKAMHTPCPVCLEDLFNSIKQVKVLDCGHTIHLDCLRTLSAVFSGLQSVRCPLCSRTIGPMKELWESIDREIQQAPMPAECQRLAKIVCHDCHEKSDVPFHIFGLKCPSCGAYNTREIDQDG